MRQFVSYIKLSFLSLICIPAGCSQNTTTGGHLPGRIHLQNSDFEYRLSRMIRFDVPVISVDSFYKRKSDFFILDTRGPEEYTVSHIQDAHFINYKRPDYTILDRVSTDTPIVIYCSVGYRSEKIGEHLQKMGFTRVFNLYGSIFEWVNHGHQIVNSQGNSTDSLHTYNKRWAKYVSNSQITKIW